jgi:hypothetical protein
VEELYKGPKDWVNLRKMVTAGGWRTRAQQVLLAQYNTQTDLEDVSTHLHEAGKQDVLAVKKSEVLIPFSTW